MDARGGPRMIGSRVGIYGQGGVVPFAFGNALQFDGVNDFVSLSSSMTLGKSSSWTISFWYKTTTGGTTFLMGNSGAQRLIYMTSTLLLFNDGVVQKGFTFTNLTNQTWRHIMVSSNAGSVKAYVDGVVSSTGAVDFTTFANDFNINAIGRNLSAYFNGTFDEIAYWGGVAGTDVNATSLYNGGNGAYAYDVIASPNRYYRLNGSGADTIAIDEGSDLVNGILNNFSGAYWVAH